MKTLLLVLSCLFAVNAKSAPSACDNAVRLIGADPAYYGLLYVIDADGRPRMLLTGAAPEKLGVDVARDDGKVVLRRIGQVVRDTGAKHTFNTITETTLTLDAHGRVTNLDTLDAAVRSDLIYQEDQRRSMLTFDYAGGCALATARSDHSAEGTYGPWDSGVDLEYDRDVCEHARDKCLPALAGAPHVSAHAPAVTAGGAASAL